MKRLAILLLGVVVALSLCSCGKTQSDDETGSSEKVDIVATPKATDPPQAAMTPEESSTVPLDIVLPEAVEGWSDTYLAFLDDNYDIFAALWPEGLSGIGFIDLDLDGTPEMIVFDQGASATLGVQLFDLVDGHVYCVSSVLENVAGAFGDKYFSKLSICTSYFEDFRLSKTDDGYTFWVLSANSTLEVSWDEIIRFDCVGDVLTLTSVCSRYVESDVDRDMTLMEQYTVNGVTSDQAAYEAARAAYEETASTGYEGQGVFLWNDMVHYNTTYDGLMAMARDAVDAYVPLVS